MGESSSKLKTDVNQIKLSYKKIQCSRGTWKRIQRIKTQKKISLILSLVLTQLSLSNFFELPSLWLPLSFCSHFLSSPPPSAVQFLTGFGGSLSHHPSTLSPINYEQGLLGVLSLFKLVNQHWMWLTLGKGVSLIRRWLFHWVLQFFHHVPREKGGSRMVISKEMSRYPRYLDDLLKKVQGGLPRLWFLGGLLFWIS